MKYLKSTSRDLRQIIDRDITVKAIAESFVSFDEERNAGYVIEFMKDKDFDVVGVRAEGVVRGYVEKEMLQGGSIADHVSEFSDLECIEEWASIPEALNLLKEKQRIFVLVMGEVAGIVTKGDLEKAAVRMWLFGLISLLEMNLLFQIRNVYPDGSWRGFLSKNRLETAEKQWVDRKRRSADIDLEECLQWADKKILVTKSDILRSNFAFSSKSECEKCFDDLQGLRDELAHSQSILANRWPNLVNLVKKAENLLDICEKPRQ